MPATPVLNDIIMFKITGVVDTGDEFTSGVIDTGGKFNAGVNVASPFKHT